jgi:hypothetical protein
MVAAASFWRCVWSPTGTGNVLLVWADPEASGLGGEAPLAVWADNEALGRLVAGRFVQHFADLRRKLHRCEGLLQERLAFLGVEELERGRQVLEV